MRMTKFFLLPWGFWGLAPKCCILGTPEVLGKWDKWSPYNPIQVSCFLFS